LQKNWCVDKGDRGFIVAGIGVDMWQFGGEEKLLPIEAV